MRDICIYRFYIPCLLNVVTFPAFSVYDRITRCIANISTLNYIIIIYIGSHGGLLLISADILFEKIISDLLRPTAGILHTGRFLIWNIDPTTTMIANTI